MAYNIGLFFTFQKTGLFERGKPTHNPKYLWHTKELNVKMENKIQKKVGIA
jgi:hypothetical protein